MYTFENKTYTTLADWLREYPIYKHYTDLLKSGVSTVEGMTRAIYQRQQNSRKAALKNSRHNDSFTFSPRRKVK